MNFQNIALVKDHQFYLEQAFKEGREELKKNNLRLKSEINKARKRELVKITAINNKLSRDLRVIVKAFPRVDEIGPFYMELFRCYFSVDQYKKDLANISWASRKVEQFSNIYAKKIKTSTKKEEIEQFSKSYFGRICSFLKQVKKSFENLNEYRRNLREMPEIKEDCVNVALFGFPNVGKSTLLSKLTTAKPEVASYAFTTKRINIGYSKFGNIKAQIFDTPGTLNRFEKMNDVEKQAFLVVKELADIIVYVFDPTESYSLEDQKALLKKLKNITRKNKTMIKYVTKKDLKDVASFEKNGCLSDINELQKEIKKAALKKELELLKKSKEKN